MNDWDGLRFYLDDLGKTVTEANGVADRLDDLRSKLKNATLPAGAFGSSHEAETVTGAWNKAAEQRIADAKKLRDNTASLAYKLEWTVRNFADAEASNVQGVNRVAAKIQEDIMDAHLRRSNDGAGDSDKSFGDPSDGDYDPNPDDGPVGDPARGGGRGARTVPEPGGGVY